MKRPALIGTRADVGSASSCLHHWLMPVNERLLSPRGACCPARAPASAPIQVIREVIPTCGWISALLIGKRASFATVEGERGLAVASDACGIRPAQRQRSPDLSLAGSGRRSLLICLPRSCGDKGNDDLQPGLPETIRFDDQLMGWTGCTRRRVSCGVTAKPEQPHEQDNLEHRS